jgi:ABC-2 type transport system ATP-binding protein
MTGDTQGQSPSSVIRLETVTKAFAGAVAVDRLSLQVNAGEVFALLGPNGAGKTTTVRMLVGIIRPDAGRIEMCVDGREKQRPPPERTGYLPEDRGLYRDIPVLRSLVYFGMLRGLEKAEATRRAQSWLERMGLIERRNDRLDALSKGNQQRVQLIAAVLHRPALAILDEPFTGLDPVSQEFFLELVNDLKESGTTILLSAHQMDLVERIADRVLLMNHGREILSGSVNEMHERLDGRPRLRLRLESGGNAGTLRTDADVEEFEIHDGQIHITLRPGSPTSQFLARAVTKAPVESVSTEAPRLHDIFVRAVREDDARLAGNTP